MIDIDNRVRLTFSVAYARLAERGLLTESQLERVHALIESLDDTAFTALQDELTSLGEQAEGQR